MYRPDVVYGLVRDGDELDGTVADLTAHGIRQGEIDVRTPPPGRYALADECLHDDGVAAGRGALFGTLVGLAAAAVVAGVLTVVTGRATGAVWVGALLAGAGFGAMVGAMYGLQTVERLDDDAVRYAELDDPSGWRLVAVRCLHWRTRAHAILQRHGAAIVDSPTPEVR